MLQSIRRSVSSTAALLCEGKAGSVTSCWIQAFGSSIFVGGADVTPADGFQVAPADGIVQFTLWHTDQLWAVKPSGTATVHVLITHG